MTKRGIYVILAAMAAASWAAAQQASQPATSAATSAPSPARSPASSSAPARDPTEAQPRLKTYLGAGAVARPIDRAVLPHIVRRGFVQVGSQPPEAIIDVDGAGMMTVRAGSTVTLPGRGGETITAEVRRVSADEIELLVSASGQKIIIR